MKGSLFKGVPPYGRLRLHLNLALWHLRQARKITGENAPIQAILPEFKEEMMLLTHEASQGTLTCLNILGGPHPMNTEKHS